MPASKYYGASTLTFFASADIPPRVDSRQGTVELFYGSALVKHWGIAVGPKCPRDYLPAERCQRVYEGVWVFEDFY